MVHSSISVEDFWSKVEVRGDDECWLWKGSVSDHGYGHFKKHGPDRYAHRVSYKLANGEILPKMVIRHTCDVKLCVNPGHLLMGTIADNNKDFYERGHGNRGEVNVWSKLTEKQVLEIRKDSRPSSSVAKDYSVSPRHIRKIRAKTRWAHLN